MSEGLRIGVIGATGAVGGEVLELLSESSLEIADLVLVATEESLGKDVEFQGEVYPVLGEVPQMGGLDLLFGQNADISRALSPWTPPRMRVLISSIRARVASSAPTAFWPCRDSYSVRTGVISACQFA